MSNVCQGCGKEPLKIYSLEGKLKSDCLCSDCYKEINKLPIYEMLNVNGVITKTIVGYRYPNI